MPRDITPERLKRCFYVFLSLCSSIVWSFNLALQKLKMLKKENNKNKNRPSTGRFLYAILFCGLPNNIVYPTRAP